MLKALKARAKQLETETYALAIAYKDPRVPWYAKALGAFVVAHTLSPIDLIPDFIPIFGYLDDLIITPLGLVLALRMIPPEVMASARLQAVGSLAQGHNLRRAGIAIVLSIWAVGLLITAVILISAISGRMSP
jgi:uncharacterized membrane protein YkvA (DUF1232 family)